MKATITTTNETFSVDLDAPIDISIPLRAGKENVNAWYVDPMKIEPVRANGFLGSVAEGGAVNFRNIFFNPHGNGTHTECVGHISEEVHSLNQHLKTFFFKALLISITPEKVKESTDKWQAEDDLITLQQIKTAIGEERPEAIIIRTLPNPVEKMNRQYSNSNPFYMDDEAAAYIASIGIQHLLIDLPSVDREEDGGALLSHHSFWNYPENPRFQNTITELIYVPEHVADGLYLLNLQIASFENDASPSKPILYKLA
jgi:arylformamidase